jgi:hypothetical protein
VSALVPALGFLALGLLVGGAVLLGVTLFAVAFLLETQL